MNIQKIEFFKQRPALGQLVINDEASFSEINELIKENIGYQPHTAQGKILDALIEHLEDETRRVSLQTRLQETLKAHGSVARTTSELDVGSWEQVIRVIVEELQEPLQARGLSFNTGATSYLLPGEAVTPYVAGTTSGDEFYETNTNVWTTFDVLAITEVAVWAIAVAVVVVIGEEGGTAQNALNAHSAAQNALSYEDLTRISRLIAHAGRFN